MQGPTALTFLPHGPCGGSPDPSRGLLAVAEEHQVGVGVGVQGEGREAGIPGVDAQDRMFGCMGYAISVLVREAMEAAPSRTSGKGLRAGRGEGLHERKPGAGVGQVWGRQKRVWG